MISPSSDFVYNKFVEYYQKNSDVIAPPGSLEKREFGFILLKKGIMLRHKCFNDVTSLRSFLIKLVPSDVYYSSAYYGKPEEEMGKKEWLGADLIFDIDADHIRTPCQKTHDVWKCGDCGATARGLAVRECPTCGKQKINKKTWLCDACLEAAKAETMKLIDILIEDFGFSKDELKVGFSGHRGYHVQVESEDIWPLDSMARKEIVDYVTGMGLEVGYHGVGERNGRKSRLLAGPSLDDLGWRGRIARGTFDFLLKATVKELEKTGLKKKAVDTIIQYREKILASWKDEGPWGIIEGVGKESWKKVAEYGLTRQSTNIDTVVTSDTHRLIRLSNTLHGKTGLKKIEIPILGLEQFDPLRSAVAFTKGATTVIVSNVPEFRFGDRIYGPYQGQKVEELPTAVALFLVCKSVAEVVR